MRKSPKSQQITVLFSWSLPLHGKAKPYFFFRIISFFLMREPGDIGALGSLNRNKKQVREIVKK